MTETTIDFDPTELLIPKRKIMGMSAILLPIELNNRVDWAGFETLLGRTLDAGLVPAVNMDTGYAHLIDEATRQEVLDRTAAVTDGGRFVAGVFVGDRPGATFDLDQYRQGIDPIESAGGTPIFFQSYGLVEQSDDQIVASYEQLARACDQFLFFELGTAFAPFGRIYSLDVYRQLMMIPGAIGAKHSSLKREPEWQRLQLRNRLRPDFRVFTGNDLAIDMVQYGSDYLLGLSAFAPDAFAVRDALWEAGDRRFYELNDWLQYLGFFAFRDPIPAYKHSAAMFLKLRRIIAHDVTYRQSPVRPESDREILRTILSNLQNVLQESV